MMMALNNGNGNGNGDDGFTKVRRRLLLYGGFAGIFIYLGITEIMSRPFHVEWIIAFLAMMGISLAQGVDKK